MIDLHTHLLPDWDDGAKDWDEMLEMCGIAKEDGIQKIVMTPHIFRMSKHHDDMGVLNKRFSDVMRKDRELPVMVFRGAEVYVHHDIVETLKTNDFSVNSSNYVFIEFPSDSIPPGTKDLFFNIMLLGFIPIISHPERNSVFQDRPDLLYRLIEMDCLAQVTAMSLTGEFGPRTKKAAQLFLKNNLVHVIASDAHNAKTRPPVLRGGVEEAAKIVGEEKAKAMVTSIPQAVLDNKDIPEFGEPVNPVKHKKWAIKIPVFKKH